MDADEEDGDEAAGAATTPPAAGAAAAWGCALVAGVAFALAFGWPWLAMFQVEGSLEAGAGPVPRRIRMAGIGIVALVSGLYAVGMWRMLRRPRPRRPPRWAALTGLTLLAASVGGWAAALVGILLGYGA